MDLMLSILFVCLGNICRSPMAEGALRAEAAGRNLDLIVDFAGTGNRHAAKTPDRRAATPAHLLRRPPPDYTPRSASIASSS